MNNQFPWLPDGTNAYAVVPVDVTTGVPLAAMDPGETVKVLGVCNDVDNIMRDTWDGPTPLYVFPTAPVQMQLSSTSASDAAGGTGGRTVKIYYLDSGLVPREEIVTLNGITPVLTVATDIYRVNKMHLYSVGSAQVAAGTVSLRAVGGATTYALISAGRNFSRQAVYTVPAGKFLRIEHWQVSSGSAGNHFTRHTLVADTDDGVLNSGVFLPKDEHGTQNGGGTMDYGFAIENFPAGCTLKVGVVSDNNAADVIAMTAIFARLYNA